MYSTLYSKLADLADFRFFFRMDYTYVMSGKIDESIFFSKVNLKFLWKFTSGENSTDAQFKSTSRAVKPHIKIHRTSHFTNGKSQRERHTTQDREPYSSVPPSPIDQGSTSTRRHMEYGTQRQLHRLSLFVMPCPGEE